ncbi:restriction endonuclease [Streptomyces sp. NPDC058625]|uniref:restriction endonuclease n=1 Tax=Streptomyces sp. NPDC058625 TaxID=3346564 RepID=UPI003663408C
MPAPQTPRHPGRSGPRGERRADAQDDDLAGVRTACRRSAATRRLHRRRRTAARSDRGIDITGRIADGRTVAVQCERENRSGRWTVPSADLQKFADAVRAINRVDLALFVATCDFSHTSQAIADLTGVVTVNREEVEAWTAGVRLKALR